MKSYRGWPWRWQPGDTCYARTISGGFTAEVRIIERIDDMQWPHYIVEDACGLRWRIPQLLLSSTCLRKSVLKGYK
jgi:hypothetical protein